MRIKKSHADQYLGVSSRRNTESLWFEALQRRKKRAELPFQSSARGSIEGLRSRS